MQLQVFTPSTIKSSFLPIVVDDSKRDDDQRSCGITSNNQEMGGAMEFILRSPEEVFQLSGTYEEERKRQHRPLKRKLSRVSNLWVSQTNFIPLQENDEHPINLQTIPCGHNDKSLLRVQQTAKDNSEDMSCHHRFPEDVDLKAFTDTETFAFTSPPRTPTPKHDNYSSDVFSHPPSPPPPRRRRGL